MPRKTWIKSNTGIYHIILRGINKENIFEEGQDKKKFIVMLRYFYKLMDEENKDECLETEDKQKLSDPEARISY